MSIIEAVETNNLEALNDALKFVSSNVLVNDMSPLMHAAYWGLFDVIDVLLKRLTLTVYIDKRLLLKITDD